MKILFLGNTDLELVDWLSHNGNDVVFMDDKITYDYIYDLKSEIIISYGYKHIITKDIIQNFKGNIINLHISYLPWNKGSAPNLWSFIDNTKKGVTIHFIDEGIDTGDIILQKELHFDEHSETLSTSYNTLQEEIKQMFKDNWVDIINNNFKTKHQNIGDGSIHYDKGTNKFISSLDVTDVWNVPISELKKRL